MSSGGEAQVPKRRRGANGVAPATTNDSPAAARAAPAAAAASAARKRPSMSGARAATNRRRARGATPVTYQWKPQRSGLPTEVRSEMASLLKSGKTAAEREAEAAAAAVREQQRKQTETPADAEDGEHAQGDALPREPKRSHHNQGLALPNPVPKGWVHVEPKGGSKNRLRGVRRD